jgi:hypothetical protein
MQIIGTLTNYREMATANEYLTVSLEILIRFKPKERKYFLGGCKGLIQVSQKKSFPEILRIMPQYECHFASGNTVTVKDLNTFK